MKEICGYVDKNGQFHKTETECKLADIRIKMKETSDFLDHFEQDVSYLIFKCKAMECDYTGISRLDALEKKIYDAVSRMILKDSDEWQEIIRRRSELEDELDFLYANEKAAKWWLRFKWWE